MNQRIEAFVLANPWTAPFVAVANTAYAALEWFTNHADTITKFVALTGALIGLGAAYYSFRINRRAWKRGERQHK